MSRTSYLVLLAVLALTAGLSGADPKPSRKRAAPADDTKHWAFQSVRRPAVPAVRNKAWVRTPIDAFILAALDRRGISPSPPADPRTLLRRLYLDVIGLPPTPAEQRAFLADPSPEAYARVVDDLLSRPQYGERWARHWLDVVRYADTNGYERDGDKPSAWRFRDYVIDAFNKDKPYDRFVLEQLAGDELDDTSAETQIATTFLRLGTWDDEPADPLADRYDQLDDVLGTTAAAFLGITLRCARCHDHKFEPFSQLDYYRTLALFEPLKRPQEDREDCDRVVGTPKELAKHQTALAEFNAAYFPVQRQLDSLQKTLLERYRSKLTKDQHEPPKFLAEVIRALEMDAAKRNTPQQQLLRRHGNEIEAELRKVSTKEELSRCRALQYKLAGFEANRPVEPTRAYVWYEDSPTAPVTRIFKRGDPNRAGREIGPGAPEVLVSRPLAPPKPLAKSTGRRRWLAGWLTSPDNPLTARVMVNRLWQHHFGEGLVASENDFGVMGQKPSHPELLDWLATEFMARGWSMKAVHRLILLSNTYQVTSATHRAGLAADPDNTLLWHWRQRRLEAEAVRDGALAVSGRLNLQAGGPGVYPPLPRAVLEGQSRPGDGWGKSSEAEVSRRSVYIFVKRSVGVPEIELLDSPDTTSSCEQRPVSTTGPQALTFLNGDFIQRQAGALADRLVREAGTDAPTQVERAFELALCRPPRADERQAALGFLESQRRRIEADGGTTDSRRKALHAFCLVLLNTNEFTYWN